MTGHRQGLVLHLSLPSLWLVSPFLLASGCAVHQTLLTTGRHRGPMQQLDPHQSLLPVSLDSLG